MRWVVGPISEWLCVYSRTTSCIAAAALTHGAQGFATERQDIPLAVIIACEGRFRPCIRSAVRCARGVGHGLFADGNGPLGYKNSVACRRAVEVLGRLREREHGLVARAR